MPLRTCVALVALSLAAGCSTLGDDPFPDAVDAGPADARADGSPADGSPSDGAPADGSPSDGAPADASQPLDAVSVGDTFGPMPSFDRHLFICVNERPTGNPKGCCKERGGDQVRDMFKKRLAAAGLNAVVRANKSGCLDECAAGVAMVVYPEQVWYGGVTVDDVQEIIDSHIIGGRFVARLMLPDQPHLGGDQVAVALRAPGPATDDDSA